MRMPSGVNELEGAPEGIAKARSIVPHHGQAAASFWSIEREGRNDGVPPRLQASLKSLDISSAVAGPRSESGTLRDRAKCRRPLASPRR